jgi:hypothetical protein
MITLNDISYVIVDSECNEMFPCGHDCTVYLKDKRQAYCHRGYDICSIISELANENINPGGSWSGVEVKEHFKDCKQSVPGMGWIVEKSEVVLTRLFSQTISPK